MPPKEHRFRPFPRHTPALKGRRIQPRAQERSDKSWVFCATDQESKPTAPPHPAVTSSVREKPRRRLRFASPKPPSQGLPLFQKQSPQGFPAGFKFCMADPDPASYDIPEPISLGTGRSAGSTSSTFAAAGCA
jgi:hypothetical protein